jgi:hypothetical protein
MNIILNQQIMVHYKRMCADPSGRAVYCVVLRPLVCWDYGFESYRGHGSLSVVSVQCCQIEVAAVGLFTRLKESYRLWCV